MLHLIKALEIKCEEPDLMDLSEVAKKQAKELVESTTEKVNEFLDDTVETFSNTLDGALSDLREVAFGTSNGRVWHEGIGAHQGMEDLQRVAKFSLMNIDVNEIGKRRTAVMDGEMDHKRAREARGDVIDDAEYEEHHKLCNRAATTIAEKSLLMIFAEQSTGAEARKAEIRPIIRDLREASLKEKEVLHIALFKATYTALLKRE